MLLAGKIVLYMHYLLYKFQFDVLLSTKTRFQKLNVVDSKIAIAQYVHFDKKLANL